MTNIYYYRTSYKDVLGVVNAMIADHTQQDSHTWLIRRYVQFFDQIDNETLDDQQIDDVIPTVKQASNLSEEEKDLNIAFLNKIKKVNKEVRSQHWMAEHLKVLHELGTTFSLAVEMEEIYEKAFELVSRVMNIDAFIIALYDEGDDEFLVPFCIDDGERYEVKKFPLGPGVISKVLKTKETYHLNTDRDFHNHKSFKWGSSVERTQSCIFVPMIINNQIKGVISAQNYTEFAYRTEHEELLKIIGIQVASAIETAKLYDKVYELSIKDDLTSLKNSRAFHNELDDYIAQCNQGENENVILMMLDSDNLKEVNDCFGHHQGDLLLENIGQALLSIKCENDEAYRYAGDEFMLLCPNSTVDQVRERAQQLQAHFRETPLYINGEAYNISVSIGIASYPEHATNAEQLKRHADDALYLSKENGKNMVSVYKKTKVV